jgi:MYXO-CTERM domain-containing protein
VDPDYTDEGDNEVIVRATDSDDARAVDETFTVTVTIIDTNGNTLSDTFEREVNDDQLFPPGADTTDTDGDGETDLVELLNGSDPNTSDRARAPILISPDDGETVSDAQPTLTVANAFSPRGLELTYTFCVVDDAGDEVGCEIDVPEGESITSVVFDEEPLGEQGTFTWYAFANDGLVDGEESLRGSFVLDAVNVAPPTPELLSPLDETVFIEGTLPALEARAVVDGDGDTVLYTFEVATDAAFAAGDVIVTSDARAVPLFSFGQVLDVGTYFWRVTASDGVAESAPSQSRSFSIDAEEENVAPSEPSIVSPTGDITAGNATLTIGAATDANGDDLTYEFELATNAVFAGAERFPATAALTQAVTQLDDDTTYFWRARAFDGALASDWVAASFHVNSENDAPTGLLLLTPPDGAVLNEEPVQFMARGAKDVDDTVLSYRFEVAKDENFNDKVIEETFDESSDIVSWIPATALKLTKGKTFFWRVTVTDADGATIEASASFAMFKKVTVKEPVTVAAGGGGLCSSSGSSPSGIALLAILTVGFGLRRRRQG